MEDFQLLTRLGVGSYAVVWKARRKSDGKIVAIKQLKDTSLTWDDVVKMPEIQSVKGLVHPNILQMLSVIRLVDTTYIVMEYCDINVYQVMSSMTASGKRFTEAEIRWIMRQTLKALAYLHSFGIMHRDVKPENLLLSSASLGSAPTLKVCDFGQAKPVTSPKLTDYVATRWYRAPELLFHSNRYDTSVDMYAAGALMAELFTLRPVFAGTSEADQIFRICSALGTFSKADWPEGHRLAASQGIAVPDLRKVGMATLIPGASPAAIQAIEAMLTWNPARRPTAEQMLTFPFFKDGMEMPPKVSPPALKVHEEALAKADAAAAQEALHHALSLASDKKDASPSASASARTEDSTAPKTALAVPPTTAPEASDRKWEHAQKSETSIPTYTATSIATSTLVSTSAAPPRRRAINPFAEVTEDVRSRATNSIAEAQPYTSDVNPLVLTAPPLDAAALIPMFAASAQVNEAKSSPSGKEGENLAAEVESEPYVPSTLQDDIPSLSSVGGLNLPMYGRRKGLPQRGGLGK